MHGSRPSPDPRPRVGGDMRAMMLLSSASCFNPRPPRGGRQLATTGQNIVDLFQSTPPARGATVDNAGFWHELRVSIHAPRAGGDRSPWLLRGGHKRFQSTPPARGATEQLAVPLGGLHVSIHAPRAGGDQDQVLMPSDAMVSIHAPRAGGDWRFTSPSFSRKVFQSTPPARGAT